MSDRNQINSVFVSTNMAPSASSIDQFHFGLECHNTFIVDFPSDLFLGDEFVPLVKLSMIRLMLSQPQSFHNYAPIVEI